MPGNTFGQSFRITTFGESHGVALGGVIDGCPPGLVLSEEDIQVEIDRRRTGRSKHVSQRSEADRVEILSGVFEGKTTGTPIGLLIRNTDARSQDYQALAQVFRPAHADYTYWHKYGIRDHQGGGRASARETIVRVAAGAIAKKYLQQHLGIVIRGCLEQMGTIELPCHDWAAVNQNPFFTGYPEKIADLETLIHDLRKAGDSIGARVYVEALNVPVGLGEPVFNKLNADLAAALMSINAAKAVEIGDGMRCVTAKGSEFRDEISPQGFLSNHAGGILGGISTGQPIIARVAFKPTPSILKPGQTVTIENVATEVVSKGRHDPCVGIRATPIVEAMVALVLMDHWLRHRGQNG